MKKYKFSTFNIIFIYSSIHIFFAMIFYRLMPILLNYPPYVIEEGYITKWSGMSYIARYIMILCVILLSGVPYLFIKLRSIRKWRTYTFTNDTEKIKAIRKTCLEFPYIVYIIQTLVPIIIFILIQSRMYVPAGIVIKSAIAMVILFMIGSIFSHIYTKHSLIKILLETFEHCEETKKSIRINISSNTFFQLIPLSMVAILFTTMVGYSALISDKGDVLFEACKSGVDNHIVGKEMNDINQLKNALSSVKLTNSQVAYFIIAPGKNIFTSDNRKLDNAFYNYLIDVSLNKNGRVYDASSEVQGLAIKVNIGDEQYIAGIKYKVASQGILTAFIVNFLVLFCLNIFVLYYFSRDISKSISNVTERLNEISESKKIDLEKKIPVVSNDEIADLVIAFNKIQARQKQMLDTIKSDQEIITEQERLASLGQLIGGIAHNLKTPIMSIAGGFEVLKQLIDEYAESIGDDSVTINDHREIARDMAEWVDKLRPHCTYMSDIISAVKGQAVNLSVESSSGFTVEELIKRIEILMKLELGKYNCVLKTHSNTDMLTVINGEINNLVQIINNIIINAIDAYDGHGGGIDLDVNLKDNYIEFTVRDYGKGIPPEIRNRLFKEMITTKGKNGTGLGLFMSYSNIKARFNGNMWFTSEEGKGTSFFITIPVKPSIQ